MAGRIEYLRQAQIELSAEISDRAERANLFDVAMVQAILKSMVANGYELQALARTLSGNKAKQRQNGISKEMIQQARLYPISRLVEFRHGKALAFCHDDKTASLTYYQARNLCRCFVCCKSFNSIDVLIERDGYSFKDAVKRLSNY